MRIFGVGRGFSGSRLGKQGLVGVLGLTLLLGTWPRNAAAQDPAPDPQTDQQQDQTQSADAAQGQDGSAAQAPQHSPQTPDQLDQLVAPVALYPDSLVA